MYRDPVTGIWMKWVIGGPDLPATPAEAEEASIREALDPPREAREIVLAPDPSWAIVDEASSLGNANVWTVQDTALITDGVFTDEEFTTEGSLDRSRRLLEAYGGSRYYTYKEEQPMHDKKELAKIQEVIKGYNKLFEEIVVNISIYINGNKEDFRQAMYGTAYFMDDAFEKALLFKSKDTPNYTLWFKNNCYWNNLYSDLQYLEGRGVLGRAGGQRYIKLNSKIIYLKWDASLSGPLERIEQWKSTKNKRAWFEHQGSWYEPVTGRYELPKSLTKTDFIRIDRNVVPLNHEVINEWLNVSASAKGTQVDPDQFYRYIEEFTNKKLEEQRDKVLFRVSQGLPPFVINETRRDPESDDTLVDVPNFEPRRRSYFAGATRSSRTPTSRRNSRPS